MSGVINEEEQTFEIKLTIHELIVLKHMIHDHGDPLKDIYEMYPSSGLDEPDNIYDYLKSLMIKVGQLRWPR